MCKSERAGSTTLSYSSHRNDRKNNENKVFYNSFGALDILPSILGISFYKYFRISYWIGRLYHRQKEGSDNWIIIIASLLLFIFSSTLVYRDFLPVTSRVNGYTSFVGRICNRFPTLARSYERWDLVNYKGKKVRIWHADSWGSCATRVCFSRPILTPTKPGLSISIYMPNII